MSSKQKPYEPPAIIFEADIETSAGSGSPIGATSLDPLKAESLGLDWPVEGDFPDPED